VACDLGRTGDDPLVTTIARPDPATVLSRLKDFQRQTAEYAFQRMYGVEDTTHRFLVADEVGLGKTLVAKGIIALAVDALWDSNRRLDVVYICSNSAIARQNINRLNITGAKDFSLASRITLLPTQLKDLSQRKLNFISFTPGTSFDLRSNLGMMDERALLHTLLTRCWHIRGASHKNALQGTASVERFRPLLEEYAEIEIAESITLSFGAALEARVVQDKASGRNDLRTRYDDLCRRFGYAGKRSNRPDEDIDLQCQVVGELRDLLATTCLKSLEPDLIILDEFQRFKHLLDAESEESRLARDLFNYSDHEYRARVLLLSATPYKMFTSADETGGDDHYEDFLATLRFLQNDPIRTKRCAQILKDYREHLLRLEPGIDSSLRSLKEELESELRRIMVRTERLAITADRDGMLRQSNAPLTVISSEATTYRGLSHLATHLDQPDPVEYWKSSPYLLSFMEAYQLKSALKEAREDSVSSGQIANLIREHRALALPWSEIAAYRVLDPGNGRMRWLIDRVIGSGAWRMLWVPPTCPWYQLAGPFADPALAKFTKTLVFSSWNVVPKAISMMVSYCAEREMMIAGGGTVENNPESRGRFSPLLRFAREGGGSLLALIYPSFCLARLGAEARNEATGELRTIEGVLEPLESRIRELLARLPNATSGREDEAWYWAAPALLDLLDDESATLEWIEETDPSWWLGSPATDEGAGVFEEIHVPALQVVLQTRGATLGPRPADLPRVLAQLAVAGPAIATLRALVNLSAGSVGTGDHDLRVYAGQVAYALRSYFNTQEVTALVRGGKENLPYWRQVLNYATDGALGAVLEEYCHVLYEWLGVTGISAVDAAADVADGIIEALTLRTASPAVDDVITEPNGGGFTIESRRMRTRFAARLGEDVMEGTEERTRVDQVRSAFNSPFWPFVLATTSVGQEGLDFHLYCHAVAHWNLPSNPVDLEQREGRVHRYKGHAVRKNVGSSQANAARVPLGHDPWQAMFEAARAERPLAGNDLWPYWIYPVANGAQIERHVPMLPLSREVERYARLRRSLALYRMVFGQPRQEDLLQFLMSHLPPEEAERQAAELRLDLSPPTISAAAILVGVV
jgi:hypothetical protein